MSTNQRLYFIDAVRAFAILMMLQGHFIDSLLAPEHRDMSHVAYRIWSYFRGITAPTFFTISGLIFTYLLLKAKEKGTEKQRMRKGLNRGLMLIGIGYLLRMPFLSWLSGHFGNTYFLVIDVLQIIGLSLMCIVGLYYICFKNARLFAMMSFAIGFTIFVCEPLYRALTLENVPLIFANYVSKANGSVFTIIPWFGYMAFGACIATAFYRHLEKRHFKAVMVALFILVGYLLIEWSSHALFYLTKWTGIELFLDASNYNYLFSRLGDVLLYFAFFYGLERFLKPPLLLKIGQKTLSIYVIHFIIIYGSFTGVGLSQLIGKTLSPWQAVFGAVLFLIVVCFISFYYVRTNAYIYGKLRQLFYKLKGTPKA
ncbi:heparan-alpha-glucosaminide N-acetyltransferase domain-containing protein [uncultured Winogradskyella sp.]|uniref:heparan-alpha-glucosaminide N-acetyltransferase domain-containing protein n=1 Tax=uncultured Winogradskyella sp. TaxID=395353 RepID=UPI00261F6295|nr:heparan-alpha-glucosaminide N-acetyltransferase domain-containing protein [uncultured Winogradskyella sp.]